MLAFFRRIIGSWVVVVLLGLIMIAFIVTGVSTDSLGSLTGPGANAVATVDGTSIAADDVARRAQGQLNQARQQQPGLLMPAMLRAIGGVGPLVESHLTGAMLEAWARRQGLVVSDRLIDGEIAGVPAFQGPTGRFDETQMRALLAQQQMSERAFRDGIRADLLRRQLLTPIGLGTQMPRALADVYAATFVARREGLVGIVPARADSVPAPSEAALAAWYKTNAARYALPERRVLRYALLGPQTVAVATPSEAEIARAYQADAAKYAAKETRTLAQVVLADRAAADALAAKVKAGTPFATAAQAAGFGPADIALGPQEKAAFARTASAAIADAAFALPQGGTTAPIKSPLGWHIVHVDAVTTVPARPLDAVRGEIAAALAKRRGIEAVSALGQKIQDAIDDGATFDEVTRDNRLTVIATPPLTAAGAAPSDPAFKPDAAAAALLRATFAGSPDDDPVLEQIGTDQQFALLAIGAVTPAAPQPLAQVRERALADYRADKAQAAARAIAQRIADKAKAGASLAAALAEAGLAAPTPLAASQLELAQNPAAPAPLRALFALSAGRNAIVQTAEGWAIVQLIGLRPGAPGLVPAIAAGLRSQLGRGIGDELIEQFARAAQKDVRIKRNQSAIAALGRQLNGETSAQGAE